MTLNVKYNTVQHKTYAIFSLSMPTIMSNLLKSSAVIYNHSQIFLSATIIIISIKQQCSNERAMSTSDFYTDTKQSKIC